MHCKLKNPNVYIPKITATFICFETLLPIINHERHRCVLKIAVCRSIMRRRCGVEGQRPVSPVPNG